MVDFALEAERRENVTPEDAIRRAALMRFRPILMTTFAALLGALPLAFGHGLGSELRRPLGVAIVGGLIASSGSVALHDARRLPGARADPQSQAHRVNTVTSAERPAASATSAGKTAPTRKS